MILERFFEQSKIVGSTKISTSYQCSLSVASPRKDSKKKHTKLMKTLSCTVKKSVQWYMTYYSKG